MSMTLGDPQASLAASNKRRCSDTALPGEHDQRRRQRLPVSSLVVSAPPVVTAVDDSNGDLRKKTDRKNVCSWSSISSGFSSSTLSTVSTPVTTISHAGMFPMITDQPLPLDLDDDEEERGDDKRIDESEQQILQRQWRRRVSRALSRSASKGNAGNVQHILTDIRLRPFLDIDAPDDEHDKITPLIYAACFGKADVVQILLDAGANSNVQDKRGWTALMWAATNNHSRVVEILLAHGASSTTQSACGRTARDFIDTDNEQMKTIFSPSLADALPPRISADPFPSTDDGRKDEHNDLSFQQQAESEQQGTSMPSDDENDLAGCEASLQSIHLFHWDRCLPDQMFVFSEENTDHILDTAITRLKLPMETHQEIWIPANIIFLSARFAHYYSSRDLLHRFLHGAVSRIDKVLKENSRDIHTLAFWMANLSQLLSYLKKDTGLVVATAEHQLTISELICETYNLVVLDSEQRIDQILEPAMLEHEPFDGFTENVNFADDWHRFFRRGRSTHRRSVIESAALPAPPTRTLSPQTVISLLSSILYVLQSYEVHPAICLQATAQFVHFLSCELFNRILGNRRYLCRSKALQIRMNLTALEEWMRHEKRQLPMSHLTSYFEPLVQLLQLLQCVSQLNELMLFANTIQTFGLLNPLQIKRCVIHYRYEVSEPRLPDEVEKYATQIARDSVRQSQQQQPRPRSFCERTIDSSRNPTSPVDPLSPFGNVVMARSETTLSDNAMPRSSHEDQSPLSPSPFMSHGDNDEDCTREWIKERRDSRYMLPFFLPNNRGWGKRSMSCDQHQQRPHDPPTDKTATLSDAMCQKLREERKKNETDIGTVPTIPEDWMDRLDCNLIS